MFGLSSTSFLDVLANRHSYYQLDSTSPISDTRIVEIVEQVLQTVPSAFNTQSTRIVLLLNKDHEKLWDNFSSVMEARLKPEQWAHTSNRLAGFRAAHGTALFFEDPEHIEPMSQKFPTYKDRWDQWAEHTNAMHQIACK